MADLTDFPAVMEFYIGPSPLNLVLGKLPRSLSFHAKLRVCVIVPGKETSIITYDWNIKFTASEIL
jgi:hypothetical protein